MPRSRVIRVEEGRHRGKKRGAYTFKFDEAEQVGIALPPARQRRPGPSRVTQNILTLISYEKMSGQHNAPAPFGRACWGR